jgi:hypothetical protein
VRRKTREQAAARKLRQKGRSLREISWELDVSLSSASVWVRGIPRGGRRDDEEPEFAIEELVPPEVAMRRCGRCREVLAETAFNRRGSGRQGWCRECFREYFRKRGDKHRQQSGEAHARRKLEAKTLIAEYLSTHPCADCGVHDARVLEFDHVGVKRGGVSVLKAQGYSVNALRREFSECEVVCVNCHRRRTARRAEWRRAARRWWKTPGPKRRETARNLAFVLSELERAACKDCGESDMSVLDYDHVGPKTGNVLELAREGVGLRRLWHEIGSCEIRCANCHRLRHAADRLAPGAGIT